MKDDELEQKN